MSKFFGLLKSLQNRNNESYTNKRDDIGELSSARSSGYSKKFKDLKISFTNFRGLIAPVFTCFKNDQDRTLDLLYIKRYAAWLKKNNVNAVLVNSHVGEVTSLTVEERKLVAEHWSHATKIEELALMLQIGYAPLPEILSLVKHACQIGVHAILCFPNTISEFRNIDELIVYLKGIADKCRPTPFFYTHIPGQTQWNFDMSEFCEKAEETIPNFFGIQCISDNLDMAARCLDGDRIVLLSTETLMAAGLILGFEAIIMTWANICPSLCHEILLAMRKSDVNKVQVKQQQLFRDIWLCLQYANDTTTIVAIMKDRFNNEMLKFDTKINAGPTRQSHRNNFKITAQEK